SGASLTSDGASSSTSETESTTMPTTRSCTLRMITTVNSLYSASPSPNLIRRSMIGTMTPRRLITLLMKLRALAIRVGLSYPRISCTLRMSMPYSSAPSRNVRYSLGMGAFLRPFTVRAGSARCMLAPCPAANPDLSVACATHQVRHVEDQRDLAVAHDGGARYAGHLAVVRLEVLHHDLVLPDQLVDQQGDPLAFGLDDDDGRIAPRRLFFS